MAEPGRALVAISSGYIGFATSCHMEFDSEAEALDFIDKWVRSGHFYNFSFLKIVPVKGNEAFDARTATGRR